jgi:hypothetical protein
VTLTYSPAGSGDVAPDFVDVQVTSTATSKAAKLVGSVWTGLGGSNTLDNGSYGGSKTATSDGLGQQITGVYNFRLPVTGNVATLSTRTLTAITPEAFPPGDPATSGTYDFESKIDFRVDLITGTSPDPAAGGSVIPPPGCAAPTDSCGGGFSPLLGGATINDGGTSAGAILSDPVNLATGMESNEPAPDLRVYNPA